MVKSGLVETGQIWQGWTYSAMITVDQERVVSLVVNDLENGCHCLNRYRLLLGALHGNVAMLDLVGLHERQKRLRQFLVDESAGRILAWCAREAKSWRDSHNGFQLEPLKESIISLLGIATPVNARNHSAKVGGLAKDVSALDHLLGYAGLGGQRRDGWLRFE